MSQNVPAWKKIGLKVKEDAIEDPLATTTHLENVALTNKEAKKIMKQKRKAAATEEKQKRPPKRVKLPKSERPAPPDKDQLTYLRQYEKDRDNWKFSKQKQNWILKNLRHIGPEYESALQIYVENLQGGSRKRVVEDVKNVIERWNGAVSQAEARVEAELSGVPKPEESVDKEAIKDGKEVSGSTDIEIKEKGEDVPDYDYAKRCAVLLKLLTDDDFKLKGIVLDDSDFHTEALQDASDPSESENGAIDNLIVEEVEVSGSSRLLDSTIKNGEESPDPNNSKSSTVLEEDENVSKSDTNEESKKNKEKTKNKSKNKSEKKPQDTQKKLKKGKKSKKDRKTK